MNPVDKIRKQIRSYRGATFKTRDLLNALDLPCPDTKIGIDWLLKRGEIERVSFGVYRVKKALTKYDKALRAMHVKRAFSVQEIAILSDAKISYVKKIISQLITSEDLEKIGHRKNRNLRDEAVFRVRHTDRFYLKYVVSQPTCR